MDVEKLTKALAKASPEDFAKFVAQAVDRLKKATDHLGNAAKHVAAAIGHNEAMGEHMDGLGDHMDALSNHMAGMKSCMGKVTGEGGLLKATEGDGKDLVTHMEGMNDAADQMADKHGKIEDLIGKQETALDSASGAIDDAVEAADEETDKGLDAAARTEKRYERKMDKMRKSLERGAAKREATLARSLTKKADAQLSAMQSGFDQLLKALAPAPAAPAGIVKAVPARTSVSFEKGLEHRPAVAAPGSSITGEPPVAKTATGTNIEAVDENGMPNPEFLKAVESGQLGPGGGKAFVKAAKDVPAQVGNPFPEGFGSAIQ